MAYNPYGSEQTPRKMAIQWLTDPIYKITPTARLLPMEDILALTMLLPTWSLLLV